MILERLEDVIVAPATPAGRSALAMVRISGPGAIRMCSQVFKGGKRLTEVGGNRLVTGVIADGEDIIDQAVVGVYRSPRSYTTEDMVELSVHGNPVITDRVTDLIEGLGARLARPGEFTERAYLHGRLDITQAEAVLAAIQAQNVRGVAAAMAQLGGGLSLRFEQMTHRLREIYSLAEARLEFPEEDVPDTPIKPLIAELENDVNQLIESFKRGRGQTTGLTVVIAGRPNVGKSTLFNALLDEERSIVTPVPGTTRDLVPGTLKFRQGHLKLFDGAGIGSAASLPDKIAVKRAAAAANRADYLLVVLDASQALTAEDRELLKMLEVKNGLAVYNKVDLVSEAPALPRGIRAEVIGVSALRKTNLSILREVLRRKALSQGETFFASRFEEERLRKVSARLRQALEAAYLDMKSRELRQALDILTDADNPKITEKTIDDIFSRFCIGK